MEIDGVFAGGGMKAIAFVGALEVMEERGFTFKRLAGTSAGAIFAALIKVGYTSEEIMTELNTVDFESLLDPQQSIIPFSFMKWLKLYRKLGLYVGEELEDWLEELLGRKGVYTFGDLEPGSLKVVASDLTKGRIIVLPDDLPEYGVIPEKFSVARAIRMSSSIPYFFRPNRLQDGKGEESIIVDGAVLSNFPIWLFSKSAESKLVRPLIGFRLTPEVDQAPSNEIHNSVDMLAALFRTMMKAHDTRYIVENDAKKIVFIPVDHVSTIDFKLNKQEKVELIRLGRYETEKFLKKWY